MLVLDEAAGKEDIETDLGRGDGSDAGDVDVIRNDRDVLAALTRLGVEPAYVEGPLQLLHAM